MPERSLYVEGDLFTTLGLNDEQRDYFIAAALVAGTATSLDIKCPTWDLKVDTNILNCEEPETSLLAQIYGDYESGLESLGILATQAEELGLTPGSASAAALDKEWKRLLHQRSGIRFANRVFNT